MSNAATTPRDTALERKLTIHAGPFKGTEIPPQELRLFEEKDEFGSKSYRAKWPHQVRLARALEVFKVEDGYGFIAKVEDDPNAITIQTRRYVNGVLTWTGPHPTQRHVAELQRNGQLLARATSLAALDVERAHESGENNALSRLLDHLGLPAYISLTAAEYALLTQQQVPVDGDGEGVPTPKAVATPGARKGTKVVPITAPKPAQPQDPTPQGDAVTAQDDAVPEEDAQAVDDAQVSAQASTDASPAPATPAAPVQASGDAPVSRNTRVRATNLWRRLRRGQPYPEPATEDATIALIADLEREVKP